MPGNRRWTEDEDDTLVAYYHRGLEVAEQKLAGRTRRAIMLRAVKLGLFYRRWTWEEDTVLRECYRDFGAEYCQRYLPGRSVVAIQCRAARLGIRRDLRKRRRGEPNGDWMAEKQHLLYGKRGESK